MQLKRHPAPCAPRERRFKSGFTLIELLVVVAIITLLISILLPALSTAKAQGRNTKCLVNLRSHAQITFLYLQANNDVFPFRLTTSSTGGGSVYGAFMPSRTILKSGRRPIEILTCPDDKEDVRDYPLGDEVGTNPDSLGLAEVYGRPVDEIVRYSYGLNNMTGIKPSTSAEKKIFNQKLNAYRFTSQTLLYADCAWVNARGHDKILNDAPRLRGRVANAGAPARMNVLADIPAEYGTIRPEFSRHPGGNNIAFMDGSASTTSQKSAFEDVLYSWTEPDPDFPPPFQP